jgi:hypothetical protein
VGDEEAGSEDDGSQLDVGTRDGGRSWNETRLPEGVRDVYAVACG